MPTRKPKPTPKDKPSDDLLPVLKPKLIRDFCRKSGTSAGDLAQRCGVSRNTLLRADDGADVKPRTLKRIAAGMGFQPTEVSSLCHGDDKFTRAQLVEEACRRLGLGLWGVCDHDFALSERFQAVIGKWSGKLTQRLVINGVNYDIIATMEGKLSIAGRTIRGRFDSKIIEPKHLENTASLCVEGYWFADSHYVGLYRWDEKSGLNFGSFQLTLSFDRMYLWGDFRGWGAEVKNWVAGELQFSRVDDNVKTHP